MANKKIKKKQNKNNIKSTNENKKESFSFDNEIVIGITKQSGTMNSKDKSQNKRKTKNKKVNTNKLNENNKKKKTNKNKKNTKSKKNKANKIENVQVKDSYIYNETILDQEELKIKRQKTIKIIKYGSILAGIIAIILFTLFSPLFNIKRIKVEGNKKISEDEIISLSQIKIDENMFKLSTGKIRKEIKSNTYIKQINIERNLPDEICIKVEERDVDYLLEYVESYLYIDKQGYILEISQEKKEVPILQGTSTIETEFKQGNRLCKEDLEKLLILDKVMEAAKVNEIAGLITRIDIDNIDNIKLIFETEDKVAYIGDINNLVTKIPTVKKILEKENGISGEIFVNMDLNKENAIFRERV